MKSIIVKIHTADGTLDDIAVVTHDGIPTNISRVDEVNYEFIDQMTGRAPDHIITRRVDNDLNVSFEKEGKAVDLVIEGFYDSSDQALIGLAEDNNFYYYIPDTGQVSDYVMQLTNGAIEGQALGGENLAFAAWFPLEGSGLPWFAGLALLPVPFLFAGGGGDDGDSTPSPKPPQETNIETVRDTAIGTTNQPTTIDVLANDTNTNPDTLLLIDPANPDTPVDTVVVAGEGTWTVGPNPGEVTFTPEAGFTDDPTPINYVVDNPQGNTSSPTQVSVDYPPTTLPDSIIAPVGVPVTQNVLNNDNQTDPNSVQLIDPANPDTPMDTVVVAGEGAWTVGPNPGEVTFTPEPGFTGDPSAINYVVNDPQGNTSQPTRVDVIPELAVASLIVSEEGLPDGIPDNTGITGDQTSSASETGLITVGDISLTGSGGALSVSLTGPSGITALGEPVSWTQSGNVLTGTAVINGSTVDIMTLTVDAFNQASNGLYTTNYTAELLHAIDHPDTSGEDSLGLGFTATVTDGSTTTNTVNFTVTVEDDMPTLYPETVKTPVPPEDVNLMLIMDTSSSMNRNDNGNPLSRLELMQEALKAAILEYENFGEVRVRLITFESDADELLNSWVPAKQAIEIIDSLSAYGGTNYIDAINAAMDAFDAPGRIEPLSANNSQGDPISNEPLNKVIFVTDGKPLGGSVDNTLENQWINFLTGNDPTHNANGLKIEADAYNIIYPAGDTTSIDPIDYDGVNDIDTNGVAVTPVELKDEILNGIEVSINDGSLVSTSENLVIGFGADDGYIAQVEFDGKTYIYDKATDTFNSGTADPATFSYDSMSNILTITSDQGSEFALDLGNGEYSFQASKVNLENYEESTTYTTQDNDGDQVENTITLNIFRFEAVSDIILTNKLDNSIELGYDLLFKNDIVTGSQILRDDLFDHISNGTLTNTSSSVTFTFDAGASNGAFNYVIEQDGGLDNATVTIAQIDDTSFGGSVNHETLIGRDGQDNTLYGQAGDDIIIGGDGADTLNGGAGADILYYDATDLLIDGGSSSQPDGTKDLDTLFIDSVSGSLTVANIDNIEILDLGNTQSDNLTLSLQDLLDMTDTDSTLLIDGDGSSDTVDIDLSVFSQAATSDIAGYELYNGSSGEKLYIETDIIVI